SGAAKEKFPIAAPDAPAPTAGMCINVRPKPDLNPVKFLAEHRRVWSDLAIVLVTAVACGWIAADFELIERLFTLTRRWERFQVDELAIVLVALAIGMSWFALRRYADARRELAMRNEAQA